MLSLLWFGHWTTDLSSPLSSSSVLRTARAAARPVPVYDLRVGGRVWLDGQGWEVAELTGRCARLIADGRLRTVSITSLVGATEPAADDVQEVGSLWVTSSVVLASLTTKQAETLTERLHTLRQVVEPEPDDSRTLGERTTTRPRRSASADAPSSVRSLGW